MLQHNRQWLRWVPFLLYVAGILFMTCAMEQTFDTAMSVAIATAPVGVGIPVVGAVICHRRRSRRVYACAAIAGGASLAAMILLIAGASALSVMGEPAFMKAAGRAFVLMLGDIWPLLIGALCATVLLTVWTFTAEKPDKPA